jgi:hypothetical protein
MGYISASTLQKIRVFAGTNEMTNMNYEPYYPPCHSIKDATTGFRIQDTVKAYEYLEMPRHLFTFWYFDGIYHNCTEFLH